MVPSPGFRFEFGTSLAHRLRVRYPALAPALAVIAGISLALVVPVRSHLFGLVPVLLLYGAAVLAFARRSKAFLAFALLDVSCTAWLLASIAEDHALHPSLLVLASPHDAAEPGQAVDSNGSQPGILGEVVLLDGRLTQDASPGPSGASLRLEAVRVVLPGDKSFEVRGGVVASVGGSLFDGRLGQWRAGRTLRAPVVLREPTTFRNPGLRDERVAMARRGIHLFASVKSPTLVEVVRRGGWWDERAADARAWTRRSIASFVGRWSQQSAAVVLAILIGDRAGLDDEVERRLQEAGTYHVIAISGGNIAILAGFLLGLLRLAGCGPRIAACATIVCLVAYADLVGAGASVVRATLMAVVYLAALLFDQRGSPVNALLFAAAAILCISPISVHDVAMPLTFGATLGILVASSIFARRLPRSAWAQVPLGLLLASASAELALLPVGAWAFNRITVAGLLLNFLAIPLMAVAQLAGMAVLPLAIVSTHLAFVAGLVAHLGAAGLISSGSLVDYAPALTWRVPSPPASVLALYYAGWLAWMAGRRWRRLVTTAVLGNEACPGASRVVVAILARHGGFALVVLAGAWILTSPAARIRGSRPTGLLRMTVIDVGQADALLVRFPDATTLLVDSGGSRAGGRFDIGGRVIMPVLWHHDVFRLDAFAMTHGDPDHIGGAVALLRDFSIREAWEGIDVPRDALVQRVRQQAAARGVPIRALRAGQRMMFGGTDMIVWHPPPPDWERQKVRNDDSIVLEFRFGDVSLLLTGDIGVDVERPLARRLSPRRICILKVPHHGSIGSSSPQFLAAVHPSLALFTIGPVQATPRPSLDAIIERYRRIGAQVLRTDEDGAIEIETDGREVRVRTFTGRTMKMGRGNAE